MFNLFGHRKSSLSLFFAFCIETLSFIYFSPFGALFYLVYPVFLLACDLSMHTRCCYVFYTTEIYLYCVLVSLHHPMYFVRQENRPHYLTTELCAGRPRHTHTFCTPMRCGGIPRDRHPAILSPRRLTPDTACSSLGSHPSPEPVLPVCLCPLTLTS